MATIHKLTNREGFGDTLADRPLAMAEKRGKKSESYLMHKKGLIQSATADFRVHINRALASTIGVGDDTIRGASV